MPLFHLKSSKIHSTALLLVLEKLVVDESMGWSSVSQASLVRVWDLHCQYCVGSKAEIIVPEDDEEKMIPSLQNVDKLLRVISNMRIENAEASKAADKENILKLVEDTIGFAKLNEKVNILLRYWTMAVLMNAGEWIKSKVDATEYDAGVLYDIGCAFHEMGDFGKAIDYYEECLAMREIINGKEEKDDFTAAITILQ